MTKNELIKKVRELSQDLHDVSMGLHAAKETLQVIPKKDNHTFDVGCLLGEEIMCRKIDTKLFDLLFNYDANQ